MDTADIEVVLLDAVTLPSRIDFDMGRSIVYHSFETTDSSGVEQRIRKQSALALTSRLVAT
ncbi:hypothetical protein [Paraburkholderia sp. MM5477-R1]|uniref:hypothetical protein n=1 Tax=Paraburkholderia sp. MM5477-R1 TaxID=2991062 RepID=UPI003D193A95